MNVEINFKLANEWKEECIRVAKEIDLFPENVINKLNDVGIQIIYKPIPEDGNIIFGYAESGGFYLDKGQLVFKQPMVYVYHKNYSTFDKFFNLLKKKGLYSSELEKMIRNLFTEEDLFETYNQSGMDHELLGHIGSWLSDKKGDERDACIVEHQVAIYRGKENEKWRYAAKFIPIFQEKHRRIPLIEYNPSLTLLNPSL